MDMNKGYAAVFKNRDIDADTAYRIAVTEITAASGLSSGEIEVWLSSYSGRLFGSEVLLYIGAGSDFEVQTAVRQVMRKWLWRRASMKQQELGAPEDTSYLMASVLLEQFGISTK